MLNEFSSSISRQFSTSFQSVRLSVKMGAGSTSSLTLYVPSPALAVRDNMIIFLSHVMLLAL
jgi:hypothetical protein